MSAGAKIVQLRDCLRRLVLYARCRPDCKSRAGEPCSCGFTAVRPLAVRLSGADPARTGGPDRRSTPSLRH